MKSSNKVAKMTGNGHSLHILFRRLYDEQINKINRPAPLIQESRLFTGKSSKSGFQTTSLSK